MKGKKLIEYANIWKVKMNYDYHSASIKIIVNDIFVDAGECIAFIKFSTFEGNTAENYGGTIYITSGMIMD